MIELRSQPNSVSLVNYPFGQWVGALVLFVFFLVIFGSLLAYPTNETSDLIFTVGLMLVLLFGMVYFARFPFKETIINSDARTIVLVTKGIFGSSLVMRSFDDVEGGAYLDKYDDDAKRSYSIGLLLKDDEPIVLSEFTEVNPGRSRKAVSEINRLLGTTLSDNDFQIRELDID